MKNEKYKEHIKESWFFAQEVSEELELKDHATTNVALSIFDKVVSPYHYFNSDTKANTEEEPPTKKQLILAKKLEIDNPENYTKKTISKKIEEVFKNG